MNEISKSKVAPRIKTLKELNFNFSLYSQNEVLLACVEKDTFSSTLSPDGLDSEVIVRKTIDELTTVLTSMS